MLFGEELWKYLEERGVVRHEHSNGLMSCYECSMIVVTGKTKTELDAEWQTTCDNIWKDITRDEIERQVWAIMKGM